MLSVCFSLGVGGVCGDGQMEIVGFLDGMNSSYAVGTGAFYLSGNNGNPGINNTGYALKKDVNFKSGRSVPIAAKNQVRAWGSLARVYLGIPTS